MNQASQSFPSRQPAVWLATCVGCLLTAAACEACPTCKDAIADGGSHHLVQGYGWSIIFMMSMPFLILAGLGSYFYYEIRRARQPREEELFPLPAYVAGNCGESVVAKGDVHGSHSWAHLPARR